MVDFPDLDPVRLGQRLIEARKARGMTQKAACEALGCSRPTLIAIEKGSRLAKPEEIVTLASLYGRSVHELVRPGEPAADFQPHLRAAVGKSGQSSSDLDQAIEALQRFAENYRQLERMAEMPAVNNYPPEVRLSERLNVVAVAEDVAVRERSRLGLGDQPVHQLRAVLESDVGLRVMYGSLPSHIAGMYAYAPGLGCCILVNRKHPAERRRGTLAHEYGHVLTDRHKPGIDYLGAGGRKSVSERFAEIFGMAFLMPATSVRRRFNDVVAASNDFQVSDLCRMAHLYFVSVEAMAYRLEGLGLIPAGAVAHLHESRFEVRKAQKILALPDQPKNDEPFPHRYIHLAVRAYERAEISEGQLAAFLERDRVSAREVVEKWSRGIDVDERGEVEERHYDAQRSLLR